MKKFKFRYESVLKMRMDREDALKNELAKLLAKRQTVVDELDSLKARFLEYSNWVEEGLKSGNSSLQMHEISSGKSYYRTNLSRTSEKLARVDNDIEKAKKLLVDAMRERKVMEKLKEKDFQNYIEEYNKSEAKAIEEIVNYKSNKAGGEE